MIKRTLQKQLQKMAATFPIIGVVGPRQSGKTTLIKETFPNYTYVNLEDLDNRSFAENDPRGFLATYKSQVIFDEVQKVPQLFSYLQVASDNAEQKGNFILSGSQHFLLLESITQSLAGRIALLTLLPLSISELVGATTSLPDDPADTIFTGFYPSLYNDSTFPTDWYQNYLQTYVERDLRQIINVHSLSTFQKFVKMCAGRIGQLINFSSLANDCGVSYNTIKEWLSILEASFIIYQLPPYYKNFSKRLIKSSKLYFCDTGLACFLLGLEKKEQVVPHYLYGALFENLVIMELAKMRYNAGRLPNLYFWRDQSGHEVDCIIEGTTTTIALEIKGGKTINQGFFANLDYWSSLASKENCAVKSYLVYAGTQEQKRSQHAVITWQKIQQLFAATTE